MPKRHPYDKVSVNQSEEVRYNRRPTDLPDVLLDEAETSLRAAFTSILRKKNREDLVEDARDRLIQWLAVYQQEGGYDEKS